MTDYAEAAVHAAIWGDPEALFDAIDAGTFTPDLFTDSPELHLAASALYRLVLAGSVPTPDLVRSELVRHGLAPPTAASLVLMRGAFERAGHRCGGLSYWLHALAEHRERERLRQGITALAFTLEAVGGPARVRDGLRELVG